MRLRSRFFYGVLFTVTSYKKKMHKIYALQMRTIAVAQTIIINNIYSTYESHGNNNINRKLLTPWIVVRDLYVYLKFSNFDNNFVTTNRRRKIDPFNRSQIRRKIYHFHFFDFFKFFYLAPATEKHVFFYRWNNQTVEVRFGKTLCDKYCLYEFSGSRAKSPQKIVSYYLLASSQRRIIILYIVDPR